MDEEVDISNKQASTAEVMLFDVAKRSSETDVPKKKKKSKHLSAYPPLHSMLLRKEGKKMTKDSNEEDNCLNDSSSVPGPSKLPATLTWKKCSNEGRALMQLDFQQFLMKLEKLTDLRPIPDKEFVETYIKAYYLTENDMEQFIKKLADLCCPSGVLHEAASQPGERLPGLPHKQEGSSEAPRRHR